MQTNEQPEHGMVLLSFNNRSNPCIEYWTIKILTNTFYVKNKSNSFVNWKMLFGKSNCESQDGVDFKDITLTLSRNRIAWIGIVFDGHTGQDRPMNDQTVSILDSCFSQQKKNSRN